MQFALPNGTDAQMESGGDLRAAILPWLEDRIMPAAWAHDSTSSATRAVSQEQARGCPPGKIAHRIESKLPRVSEEVGGDWFR